MGRTRVAGAGGEAALHSSERASDGETAPGQAEIAVDRRCSSHTWVSGIGRFRPAIAVSGRLW